jgi:hypothetical protein
MGQHKETAGVTAERPRSIPEVREAVDALRATSKDLIESSRLIAESRRITQRSWTWCRHGQ